MSATDRARDLALVAAYAASDKLATDIVLIDVSERLAITDVFVIATGSSERQVEAIVDAIEENLRLVGVKPLRREGRRDGRWVLIDYADVVVHVQHAEERVFYALERLWKDCPPIEFDPHGQAPEVIAADSSDSGDRPPVDRSDDDDEGLDLDLDALDAEIGLLDDGSLDGSVNGSTGAVEAE